MNHTKHYGRSHAHQSQVGIHLSDFMGEPAYVPWQVAYDTALLWLSCRRHLAQNHEHLQENCYLIYQIQFSHKLVATAPRACMQGAISCH